MTDTYVDIANARVDEQRQVMEKIIADGLCPFCTENLFQYHKKPVIKDGQFWIVTENQWPYENIKKQWLLISKKHIETLAEISQAAGAELIALCGELEKDFSIEGGGVCMRFGDTNYSAGTVKHIHAQFIWPDINKADFEPVRFKIGKNKEKRT